MSAPKRGDTVLVHGAIARAGQELAPVLRGVAVQEVPRLLTRRRGAGHAGTPAALAVHELRMPGDDGRSGPANPASAAAESAGYEAGWLAGQREGTALGHEEGYRSGFETGREDGYQQGLKAGRTDGQQEAHTIAKQAVEDRLRQLDHLLSALPAEMLKRLHQSEDEMAALCFEVICRIVGDAATNRQAVQDMVRHAVQQASTQLVAIHVHPADLAHLQGDADLNAWFARQSFQEGSAVQWVADDRVKLGGCILRSPRGNLDARLETQLSAVREAISRGLSRSPEIAA
ncbi:FliH/SctL family protein [Ralstonia sp. A12]|uniref:FliH/SctL family protein n=1 Tax=Ralstonia sp. A12 TaxID=1217052 RepID=UPI00057D5E5D|nr:FliH/SctL family protein [Ralstonia sp. A12]